MSLKKKTFLDVLLIRTTNNIETTVYRKPTTVIETFFKLEIVRTWSMETKHAKKR